jgi:glycosyltransferase involved in cell wall biosynthesis
MNIKPDNAMQPTVSIITPSFQQGAFIEATIRSVLTQDYPHIEYLIIDGGSTDGTLDILKRQTDPRLTWISEPDRGQADALNKGMQRARGELITFINSDDLLLPGAVRAAVEFLQTNPDADLVYGDGEYIDADGRLIDRYQSTPFDLAATLLDRQILAQPGAFWRRRVSDQIGLFDIDLHYRFDFDYWLRAALAGFHLQYLPGNCAAYRLHETSKTVSQHDQFVDDWQQITRKALAHPAFPESLRALIPKIEEVVRWGKLKARWAHGERNVLRPELVDILAHGKWTRRILAGVMLMDSYLGTQVASWMLQQVGAGRLFRMADQRRQAATDPLNAAKEG